MFKMFAKAVVSSAVFVGAGLLFLSGEAKAATPICDWAPGSNWGAHNGEQAHGFSGLLVKARDKSGNLLDINYEIKSDIPGVNGTFIDGSGTPRDVDERIFEWVPGKNGRTKSKWFGTGENIVLRDNSGNHVNNSPVNCRGWSVLGPGKSGPQVVETDQGTIGFGDIDQWGNRWVLDCMEVIGGSEKRTDFWISDISTPSGDAGKYGGRWEVIAPKLDGGTNSKYLDQGPNKFNLKNGISRQVTLVWHPNPPPPTPPEAECNLIRFLIPNDNQDGQGGNSTFSDYAVYVNDWGTPGHPAAAGSPDYQTGGVYGSPPGPWVDYSGRATEPQHGGQHVTHNFRQDNKAVSGTLRVTLVIYDRFTNSNGNHVIKVRHRSTNVVNNCWQARCDIQVYGNVPGREGNNGVMAGQKFSGRVTITNTGVNNLPSAMITHAGNFQLSATTNWFGGLTPLPLTHNLPYNGSQGHIYLAEFNFVAPNNVGSHNLSMYPDYWGRAGIGPACNSTINTYKKFSLNPVTSTTMQPNNEDPSVVQHRGTIGPNDPHVVVPYSARSTLNGNVIHSVNTSGGTTINYSYDHTSFPNLKAGDTYCTSISTPNGSGWVGPGNDLVDANDPRSSEATCATIHDRPYLRVYGGDVQAGNVCGLDPDSGEIKTYVSPHSAKTGSGGQLGAFAPKSIEEFISASLRYSLATPKPPKGLTFANFGAGTGSYGGNLEAGICATNYFGSRDANAETIANSNGLPEIKNKSGKFNGNGSVTLGNGNNVSGQKAIYVEGDVYIDQNITYLNPGNYSSVENIPRFTLIVTGNIYIDKGVTRLDGTFVAGGKISTCASGFQSYPNSQLWDNCRANQLTVYGAFMAPEIEFLRTKGSLRDSLRNNDGQTRTNAGEIFIYSPEVFLAPLLPGASGGAGGGEAQIRLPDSYDAITTLPPIL